ncbi:MAG TPA: tetratricopeptide repeat protein [Ideonella sp.]|uniref:O-linked N-acetylglucosamine transferase, SPINDLY family protein n=1 Tax=Ideonella sp. TaxID=1929293 RepID=UPI002B83764A|nr:tetratricopeptide repeat protein [Ideonella sp.]HSI47695.1 tetratricopeptide repeat protein [Ideonella sp.]
MSRHATALPNALERHWQAGLQALKSRAWDRAIAEFGHGARLAPSDRLMWLNLARAQLASGALDAAIDASRQARALMPEDPLACRLLAECLVRQHRFAEAAQVFDAYPPQAARDFEWYQAQGNALFQSQRLQDAVSAFFQALALKIDDALTHYRLGLCFKDLGLTREATECFRTAVSLDNDSTRALALSLLVHEGRQTCDWRLVDQDTAELLQAIDQADDKTGQLLSPFALLAVDATPAQQRRIGEIRAKGLARELKPLPAPAGPRRPGRIRVGYLSSDFHQHATSVLMAELLERRDSSRFEVTLYSHSTNDGSAVMRRVRAACEHFVDVTHMTHVAIAQRMRDDAIDIAVDLKGHTRGSRFELLAQRPAPMQVAYLGYPASTGADYIDYMIGDPVVTPLSHAASYSEHIAQLPNSYQPNDRQRPLPPAPSRASLGLPQDAVVLCCFNQVYKMSPHMLDLWAAILAQAPRAVLWMLAWNPHGQANLQRELEARGVPASRIFWAPKLHLGEHIARLRQADLFLDTWPCNAHTTASEALWAGVPVLTVPGATYASRVAASLVHACGLPDLACASEADYVGLATALANEPQVLQGLKAQLDEHRLALPLFDTDRYASDYEALLQRMFERQQAGLAPTALPAA